MMLGGGLMMVVILLALLALISVPVLLVLALAGGAAGLFHKRNETPVVFQQPVNRSSEPIAQTNRDIGTFTRYCSHCGAGLQAEWTHCPQCGAPIS